MFPLPKKAAYVKFRNQASRYALVGVFVARRPSDVRVAVTGAGSDGVFRVTAFEEALEEALLAKALDGIDGAGRRAEQRHPRRRRIPRALIGVLARRAVEAADGQEVTTCGIVPVT